MKKSKPIRLPIEITFKLEQEARILAAKLETEINVTTIMRELIKGIDDATKKVEENFRKNGKE